MYNDIISIGPVTIHGYGMMIGIGVLAAISTALYRSKKKDIDPDNVIDITLTSLIFGFLGAKLLFCILSFEEFIQNPLKTLLSGNGFVVFGGIIGGLIAAYVYCRIKKVNFLKIVDFMLPEIAIAQGFGRIGCLLAGCCYGKATDSHMGIVFHTSNYAPNGISLIPTQIIFSICAFALAVFLILYSKYSKTDGEIGSLYLILYSAGRFVLEYLRGDYRGTIFNIFSTSQFIGIFTFILGIVLFIICRRKRSS